jgi:hypothetical protein
MSCNTGTPRFLGARCSMPAVRRRSRPPWPKTAHRDLSVLCSTASAPTCSQALIASGKNSRCVTIARQTPLLQGTSSAQGSISYSGDPLQEVVVTATGSQGNQFLQGNQPLQVAMNVRPFFQIFAIWWLGLFGKDPDQNPMPPTLPPIERPAPNQRPGSDDPNQQQMIPFLPFIAPGTYIPGVTSPFWVPGGVVIA